MEISKPGVYQLTEEEYHGDELIPGGSLSCSGAQLLLPPNCPAVFDHARRNGGREPSKAMELGTAAHREVLGVGWDYKVGEWEEYRTAEARQWLKDCRAAGVVPLKPSEHEQIAAMAAAIRAHPSASLLLQAPEVMAETSFYWLDEEFGFWKRARFDAVRLEGRVVISDFKSCVSADPGEFARAAGRYRYHMKHPWYTEAVTHTLGDSDPLFLFVAQEKTPPYLVGIYELDAEAIEAGMVRNRAACRVYARCLKAGEWPGYQPGGQPVTTISIPRWAL